MVAAARVVVHVPEPTGSGQVVAVAPRTKGATLANALADAGVSRQAVADAVGVSRQRVDAWACPDHDAEPHLGHVRRMPRSVRKAIGQALVDGAEAQIVPMPSACWERALLGLVARVASLSVRVEEARDRGDRKALVALLRELTATQDDMARFVAGVRVAMEAVR